MPLPRRLLLASRALLQDYKLNDYGSSSSSESASAKGFHAFLAHDAANDSLIFAGVATFIVLVQARAAEAVLSFRALTRTRRTQAMYHLTFYCQPRLQVRGVAFYALRIVFLFSPFPLPS